MKRNLKLLVVLAACAAQWVMAIPEEGTVIELWPEGVPRGKGTLADEVWEEDRYSNVHVPTLTYFAPAVDRPSGTAVIICPGGGYARLSTIREGHQYARWLSQQGITSFVLKNRLKEYGQPFPLQDVLRAIRLVRDNAETYGVNPKSIGVMGSSAGGHLAASASTLYDLEDGKTGARIDDVDARPDFAILMYPVISMVEGVTHQGSKDNLIGTNPSEKMATLYSLEEQVTGETPPTLLIHTQEDVSVPVANSLRYFQALTDAGVPAELLVFEKGEHGMGMRPGLGTASEWPARATEWLRMRGLVSE